MVYMISIGTERITTVASLYAVEAMCKCYAMRGAGQCDDPVVIKNVHGRTMFKGWSWGEVGRSVNEYQKSN